MKKPIKGLLKKGEYKVSGSLWIEGNGTRFWGPGPVELLEHIEATGSINQAAKEMGMSYKSLGDCEPAQRYDYRSLVITATGGEKGGGSSISPEAKQMITYHHLFAS